MTYVADDLVATDIEAYLAEHESKSLLRFITCGSVDDGKSTLIGRLLFESKMVFADHLDALAAESAKFGTQGADLDFALLVDGLSAEREQGITIDVAYRFFTTKSRKFIVADTPGHEQYTRNMVTGASTADLAVVMVDARQGVRTQSRRHSYLASLLGITRVVVAVNKMDLLDYSETVFRQIESEFLDFASDLGFEDIVCIPVSALRGDNVVEPSAAMPWYTGPTLLGHLDAVPVGRAHANADFRFPVQWVNRPDLDFRGFSGQVARGRVTVGDEVTVLPAGTTARISRIVTADGDFVDARQGDAVTLTLDVEVDVSRGDVLAVSTDPTHPAHASDQFEADIVWMHEDAMVPGRPYLIKMGTTTVGAVVQSPKYRVDVNTLQKLAATGLGMNEIGRCVVSLDRATVFEPYAECRDLGGFIVIDKLTNATVGAGMVRFALRRSENIRWQQVDITKQARSTAKNQRPLVLWFTGFSGAGKSTIANRVEQRLHALGCHTYLMDGDNVRHGLCHDLGFTAADRSENVRRIGEVAGLMVDAGLITLVAAISPNRSERDGVRAKFPADEFIEVFVDTALDEAERRDPKGLYRKARSGELVNFTGVDAPYEPPLAPEIRLDTASLTADHAADAVIAALRDRGVIR